MTGAPGVRGAFVRGAFIDIGGRRLRTVCAGPAGAAPTVVFEAGSYGIAADWAVVQDLLAAEGIRSIAYDRAGLGYSDPGPAPRDGLAVVVDLEALLAAAGEPEPYIVVGHSMAGLWTSLFAARNPGRVRGLVLVDAATPAATDSEPARFLIRQYHVLSKAAGWSASLGLLGPLSPFFVDGMQLPVEAGAEKRRMFGDAGHTAAAAEEIAQWMQAAAQAQAAGPLDPDLPVAVVTAGRGLAGWKGEPDAPARRARRGYVAHVAEADHVNLLGPHAGEIIKAIAFVMEAAAETA